MDQSTITTLTRNGLRDLRYSSTDIESMTLLGVLQLGKKLRSCDPTFFRGRKILTSNTHIFSWPSDCERVEAVFDTLTSSVAITGATNASPISITATSHGRSEDDKVLITGVAGNTAANGTWQIAYVDANTFTLDGSTGNAAYTSGGQVIKWSSTFRKLKKKDPREQNLQSRYKYYTEGKTIVVDYYGYSYDIVIDYIQRPDAITDIPSEYHMGLVGWNVMNLLLIPQPDSKDFQDKISSYNAHKNMYQTTLNSIQETMASSLEPVEFNDVERWDII